MNRKQRPSAYVFGTERENDQNDLFSSDNVGELKDEQLGEQFAWPDEIIFLFLFLKKYLSVTHSLKLFSFHLINTQQYVLHQSPTHKILSLHHITIALQLWLGVSIALETIFYIIDSGLSSNTFSNRLDAMKSPSTAVTTWILCERIHCLRIKGISPRSAHAFESVSRRLPRIVFVYVYPLLEDRRNEKCWTEIGIQNHFQSDQSASIIIIIAA